MYQLIDDGFHAWSLLQIALPHEVFHVGESLYRIFLAIHPILDLVGIRLLGSLRRDAAVVVQESPYGPGREVLGYPSVPTPHHEEACHDAVERVALLGGERAATHLVEAQIAEEAVSLTAAHRLVLPIGIAPLALLLP